MPAVHPSATPSHLHGRNGGVFPYHAGMRWSPRSLGAKLLADYDVTRIRPAYGAGPHSRAAVLMEATTPGANNSLFQGLGALHSTDSGVISAIGRARVDDLAGGTTLHSIFRNVYALGATETYVVLYVTSAGVATLTTYDAAGGGGPTGTSATVSGIVEGELFSFVATYATDGSSKTLQAATSAGTSAKASQVGGSDFGALPGLEIEVGNWLEAHHTEGAISELALIDGELSASDVTDFFAGKSPHELSVTPLHAWDLQGNGSDTGSSDNPITLAALGTASFSSGDKLGVLRDLSGNGRHGFGFGQGMAVSGSGNARYMDASGNADTQILIDQVVAAGHPVELHVAVRAPSATGATRVALCLQNANTDERVAIYFDGANIPSAFVIDSDPTSDNLTGSAITGGEWAVLTFRQESATSYALDVNGVQVDSGTSDIDLSGLTVLRVGVQYAAGSNPYNDQIGRISATRTLTAAERLRLVRYLARPQQIAVA